jgi:enamine deaminase RidA (YjgF/YER057c/UK114 family)
MDRPVTDGAVPERPEGDEVAVRPSEGRTPHLVLNPAWLPPAVGFAHVVVPAHGLLVFLGGQAGHRPDGTLASEDLVDQFDQACGNLVEALAAAGGAPEHLVSMQIFVTDAEEYRQRSEDIGAVWRKYFGRHYPAMALLEVKGLFDPAAKVELMGVAVVPERVAGG